MNKNGQETMARTTEQQLGLESRLKTEKLRHTEKGQLGQE